MKNQIDYKEEFNNIESEYYIDIDFFCGIFKDNGIALNEIQINKFIAFYKYLLQINNIHNLTAITKFKEVCVKHFLDSALALKFLKEGSRIIDIGAGAGFPSIPLKILNESFNITMVDSLNKRVEFLKDTSNLLNFENINLLHSRAEDLPLIHKESFDCAVARAVAPLNILLEYCLPYVKLGGIFLAYKSKEMDNELNTSQNALNILGGKIDKIERFNMLEMERNIIIIKKIGLSNTKYPRKGNLPRIKPL